MSFVATEMVVIGDVFSNYVIFAISAIMINYSTTVTDSIYCKEDHGIADKATTEAFILSQ